MNDAPFFIVASERSGTTMLRIMLDHHPRICCHSEFEYVVDYMPPETGWPDLDAYHAELRAHRIFEHDGFSIDPSLDYPRLVKSFLEQKQAASGKPLIGATVHRHFDRLLRIWPEARFIHLLRDGRDVAYSMIGMGWAGNVWTASRQWLEDETLWDRMCELVPPERRLDVRFEELVAAPVEWLTKICAFMGERFEPHMLEYPKRTTYGPPDPSIAYKWKKWPPRDIQLAEARLVDMLVARGYELSGLPRLKISPFLKRWLLLQDMCYRQKVNVQRYGVGLTLMTFIARRLRWERLRRAARRRRNEINKTLLK